jgi:POT family proton-dependent oligopeptide transporter
VPILSQLTSKLQRRQASNIVMITFWSQFAAFAFNTIFILFLTRPILMHGLGYNQGKAYAFIGIYSATSYLTPILGGAMADKVLGLRRSILLGGFLLALAYLLLILSEYTVAFQGDTLFLAAIAFVPTANSLLMGTASGMISRIYSCNAVKAKAAMTYYYLAINIGGLLATFIAPALLDSRYGALSVFALAFAGKAIAALNFAYRYSIYDSIASGPDKQPITSKMVLQVIAYLIALYTFALSAFLHIYFFSMIITIGCVLGMVWFLIATSVLKPHARTKQFIALLLTTEAIVFFVIYNQMSTTLILFALKNSTNQLLGLTLSPAHYQALNPLLIIFLGLQLPRFYKRFPRFSIPYQFACGTLLSGIALLTLACAPSVNNDGMISAYVIAFTYILISLAELWVSAIGLSMIGLYCDQRTLGFAMGIWYLACSLSNTISGHVAQWVAIPEGNTNPIQSLPIYQHYYQHMSLVACVLGGVMLLIAYGLHAQLDKKTHIILV